MDMKTLDALNRLACLADAPDDMTVREAVKHYLEHADAARARREREREDGK